MQRWQSLDECSRALQAEADTLGVDLSGWQTVVSSRQYRTLAALVQAYVPLRASILDWGAGRGTFAYWLLRRGQKHVQTFDLREPEFYSSLQQLGNESYRHLVATPEEFTSLPYHDDEFDVVTSVGVFEHVGEYGGSEIGSLREIRRVLRPGGRFICVHLPNEHSWIEALSRRLGRYSHVRRFERSEMIALLEATGFAVERWVIYGALPRNISGKLPRKIYNSSLTATAVDALDAAALAISRRWAQNHAFVARAL